MQMLKKIIVINVSALLLLSCSYIKPTADLSHIQIFETIKDNKKAKDAFNIYHWELTQKNPYTALEQAEILISTPGLSSAKQKEIAQWASAELHPLLYKNANKTAEIFSKIAETFTQDLLAQATLKKSIINKLSSMEKPKSTAIKILTSGLFSLQEQTLLTEHFSMLITSNFIENGHTSIALSEIIDDFITFNDVGEIEKKAYSKLIAIQEELLIKSLTAIRKPEQRKRQNHAFAEILTQQRSNISTDYLHKLDENAMERQIYESRVEDMKKRLEVTETTSLQQ